MHCPVCGDGELKKTDQVVFLHETLDRWEGALEIRFPDAIRAAYANQLKLPQILWRCRRCGFGRFDPPVAGTEAFYEAIRDTDYYVEGKWEFEQAIRDLKALKAHRVLDVGCGSGHFLKALRRAAPDMALAGYELNTNLLESIRLQGFEALHGEPATLEASFADIVSFDAICLFQVVEHVEDPVAFIRSFAALLKPGGAMIVTTPNAAGPIRHFPDALTEIPPHHLTQWTEGAFRAGLWRLELEVNLIHYEPLPDYLWNGYLAVLWEEGIWPRRVFEHLAARNGLEAKDEKLAFVVNRLKAMGITRIAGVPGHTLYCLAKKKS